MATKKPVDYKAVSAAALRSALVAAEQGLHNLPDEGGREPDVVKGTRGTLTSVVENLRREINHVER